MMIVLGTHLQESNFDESFIDKNESFVLNITMPYLIISSVKYSRHFINDSLIVIFNGRK